jgi:DNA-binding NarL/FixJ family response regulator
MSDTVASSQNGRTGPAQAQAQETARIRCIVVDDHPAVRTGLRELLAIEPGLMVLEAFATAESALSFAERQRVDVAVVDYQLGGRSGLWLSRRLHGLPDPPAVLIYSAFSDWLLAAACVVAQASGLVSKTVLGGELATRIREAAAGVRHLPVVAPALSDVLRRRLDADEQAIYGMLASGISADEIARTLRMRLDDLDATLWTMLRKLERVERGIDERRA